MSHRRKRHAVAQLQKLGSFWPVSGILGLRQVGKTTLLREFLGIQNFISFDDEEMREEALKSAKNFLAKLTPPVIVDEAQKVAPVFDAIKFKVDQKRVPGSYYLSGSSSFTSRLGIRESLTGRIGNLHLYPLTLAEIAQREFDKRRADLLHYQTPRFKIEDVIQNLLVGGLPVPVFTRDSSQREQYFNNWLETALMRDVARVYGKGYDLDVSWSILRQFGQILKNGELPSLRLFKQDSRVLRRYLAAFCDVFLVRKIPCHEQGVGDDVWIFSDTGIAKAIIGTEFGEGTNLSLSRIFLLKEISAAFEYVGKTLRPTYYKSARGSPVDWVWDNVVIKVTTETKGALSYEERSLAGAMKTLGVSCGLLAAPLDSFSQPKKKGISIVPWSYWS